MAAGLGPICDLLSVSAHDTPASWRAGWELGGIKDPLYCDCQQLAIDHDKQPFEYRLRFSGGCVGGNSVGCAVTARQCYSLQVCNAFLSERCCRLLRI